MERSMPGSTMGESARRTTTGSDAAQRSIAAAVQALENLNRQEITILQQIVSSLAAPAPVERPSTNGEDGLSATSVSIKSTGDTALRGMEAAKQVQNLGFVEFTAGLINGTFDAIVGATLKQMEGYAKLVADLSKSIQQFQVENVSDAQITGHLADRYPDGEGGTSVRPGYTFTNVPEDAETGAAGKTAHEQLQNVGTALINETQRLDKELRLTRDVLGIAQDATQFTAEQVVTIRKAIGGLLATNMISQLRELARDGMARIVVTDGEIMTKLTFNITTNELQERKKENYNRNLNRTQVSGGVNAAFWKFNASTDNTNLNVNSMNESSFDSTTMSTEMIGQVKLRFKTESFPPYVPPTPPEEPAAPAQPTN